ncbi:MAG: hypothetical protein K1X44_02750 [Alphaproteobacteria bacterium]|nr:hypothetical protein [Alphaproteobacteria bacterium]
MSQSLSQSFTYDPALAKKICIQIAQGYELEKLCEDDQTLPPADQIMVWLLEEPEFYTLYMKARRIQSDMMVDKVVQIVKRTQSFLVDHEKSLSISQRFTYTRMVISTMKWIACKLNPEKYGSTKRNPNIDKLKQIEIQAIKRSVAKNQDHNSSIA